MDAGRDITKRRRRPVQKRSRETFDNVCAAASAILTEQGLEALNTNVVAERAGVSITAVYAYFPDKYAIMHELFVRSEERWREVVRPMMARWEDGGDWPELVSWGILAAAKVRVGDPDYQALRSAIRAVPELAAMENAVLGETTAQLAAELRRRRPGLPPAKAHRAARMIVLLNAAVVEECSRSGKVDRPLLDQAILMSELYLRHVLEG